MAVSEKTISARLDWAVLTAVLFLCAVGLLNLVSAAPSTAFIYRQSLSMAVSLGVLILIARMDYRLFERMAYPVYAVSLLLLIITLLKGEWVGGSRAWLRLGPLSMQPSEFVKIGTILALAKHFHERRTGGPYNLKELAQPLLIGLLPAVLIMLQPDLGTTAMLILIVGCIILFVGVRRRILVVGVTLVFLLAPLSWFFMAPHQKDRIRAFINPHVDPAGIGYNVIQSMVAVGSGKLAGKGYRLGSQTALKYLPERHTDFVFSVLGEEWGFLGGMLVLAVFFFILIWGVRIAASAKDRFGALVSLGVVMMIFWHTLVNIAMALGAFPVVGIPLPFMSYGGSFLLTVMVGVGLMMSIEKRRFIF